MNNPKVAVITRTKDRVNLLKRAIDSVHGQTMKDFVHVIINDAGDPEPVDKLIDSLSDDIKSKISLIHNSRSSGMEAATNKAVKSVKSTYVAVHDDDDSWHQDFLKQTTEHLDEARDGVLGVVVRTDKIVEKLNDDGTVKFLSRKQWMPHVKAISLYRQCTENQMTPITFVYNRSVYDKIGYYDESLPVSGDWDFGIRFLKEYDVDFLDPGFALANYHHRKFRPGASHGNTSYAGNDKARYYTNYLMNKYLREELKSGTLGVGYIMSKQRYNESRISELLGKAISSKLVGVMKRKVGN